MAGDHSLRLAKESGRRFWPSASMRKSTKACGRQQRKRARQRVEMKASPPSANGTGVIVVERPVGQLLGLAPAHADRHQVPVAILSGRRTLVGPVGEVDPFGVEIGHRIAGDAQARVEERDELRVLGLEAAAHARDFQDADPAARPELRVEDVAIVVRREIGMSLDEEDPLEAGQVRVAEHQPALGRAGVEIERFLGRGVGAGLRRQRGLPAAQLDQLRPLLFHVESLGRQAARHLFHEDEGAGQGIEPGDAAPVRRAAGHRRALDAKRRDMVGRADSLPCLPLAQKCIAEQAVPGHRIGQGDRGDVPAGAGRTAKFAAFTTAAVFQFLPSNESRTSTPSGIRSWYCPSRSREKTILETFAGTGSSIWAHSLSSLAAIQL